MKVLVTGGSGYIGSRVVNRLAEHEAVESVVNVDIAPPSASHSKVRYVERSVAEPLEDLFEGGVDVAVHLAWTVNPLVDPDRQRRICIGGTQRFLDACAFAEVPQIFFMSSGTAYGAHPEHAEPVAESTPLKARYHFQYSAEKREAEELCRRLAADRPGTLLQIGRPCVVGGPHVSNFIFRSIDKPLNFRPLGSDNPFQLVHEDDCADAVVAILLGRVPGAFNIAGDGMMPLSAVYRRLGVRAASLPAAALRSIVGAAWRRQWTQITEAPPEFLNFIVHPWLISNRRIKDELGFRFRHTMQQTLEAFIASRD